MKTTKARNKFSRRAQGFALAALILACLVSALALAEQTPAPTPPDFEEYNDKASPEDKLRIVLFYPLGGEGDDAADILYNVRQTLEKETEDYTPDYGSNMLDQNDMEAIRKIWQQKTGSNYPTRLGLTYAAMDLILMPVKPTEAPPEYQDIEWQQGSPNLQPMLEKLWNLGYIDRYDHDVYDDEVRQALRAFTGNNGMGTYFDGDTEERVSPISADLQRRIIETDEKSLVPKPDEIPENVPYFLRKVQISNFQVPMLALWAAGLAVLVIGVLVVIRLFMPSEKSARGSKHRVHFTITYEGKTQEIDAEITKTLKIGRGVGNFPLNLEDTKISRTHCELYYMNDSLKLRDYSSNGTTVSGKPVHNAECLLTSGDVILLGNHTITVTF